MIYLCSTYEGVCCRVVVRSVYGSSVEGEKARGAGNNNVVVCSSGAVVRP